MKHCLAAVLLLLLMLPVASHGEAGVIIPLNIKDKPDPNIVALGHMYTRVSIDDQFATVRIIQIFKNKIDQDIEGKYVFSLPDGAQVSAFAIWEDGVRIPAVIVEKQRASELYEELTAMKIDPGLMEQGDTDDPNMFTVRVYPIPAHGTKRIELTYTIAMPVQSLKSQFSLPLKPSLYSEQSAEAFHLDFDLRSSVPMADYQQRGQAMPLELVTENEKQITGSFKADNIVFTEDFAVEYSLNADESKLDVITQRDPREWQDIGPLSGGARFSDKSGYFAAQALFNQTGGDQEDTPLRVILLVDTSISMQWTKLTACYAATEYFLKNLADDDQFTLVTFNETVNAFSETLVPANQENTSKALGFFTDSYLRGGTDLSGALKKAMTIASISDEQTFIVLLSDGAPTAGDVVNNELSSTVKSANNNAKLMIFGLGNDARVDLLRRLASENAGHFVWAAESEDIEFKLARFFESLSEPLISNLTLAVTNNELVDAVYIDTTTSIFDRSNVTWLGRYVQPGSTSFTLGGNVNGESFSLRKDVVLPEEVTDHPQLPRRWAQLRVEHLERQIDLSEDPAAVEKMINEIVFLSKKYMFVTKYTSFLAAPRSLLRPRAMRAGDPILRVKTVEGITAVVAHFPFGLTKALHYSSEDDAWETRFLAPASMKDGSYHVDLFLTDDEGTVYTEKKQFTVDSKPPSLRLELESESYSPGQTVLLKIFADSDTRHIRIRIGDLMPVEAHWNPAEKANTALVALPANLTPGQYQIKISAVDFARNTAVLTQALIVEEK